MRIERIPVTLEFMILTIRDREMPCVQISGKVRDSGIISIQNRCGLKELQRTWTKKGVSTQPVELYYIAGAWKTFKVW